MRGKQAPKRRIVLDVKYKNAHVAKFINYLMENGKKSLAQSILYGAFDLIQKKSKQNPLEIFEKAIKNASPSLEVRGRRIGGANYQVPVPVRSERKFILASRWIIDAARKKKGRPMGEKLAQELMDAASQQGDAIKKREDVHRMAESNRAFAHFARF
ncbi:MAG: 30S ribosomal protein S7 [Parcubacteria group bacterium]|nr:30S ribosomal protein S7 [Parcubacteria group bacterium]